MMMEPLYHHKTNVKKISSTNIHLFAQPIFFLPFYPTLKVFSTENGPVAKKISGGEIKHGNLEE